MSVSSIRLHAWTMQAFFCCSVFFLLKPGISFPFRVQTEENVEKPEWNNQEHPGWDSLPRANHLQEHSPPRYWLDTSHHHRQTRLRRSGGLSGTELAECAIKNNNLCPHFSIQIWSDVAWTPLLVSRKSNLEFYGVHVAYCISLMHAATTRRIVTNFCHVKSNLQENTETHFSRVCNPDLSCCSYRMFDGT